MGIQADSNFSTKEKEKTKKDVGNYETIFLSWEMLEFMVNGLILFILKLNKIDL